MEKRQVYRPFQVVAGDCIGPFPPSKMGYTNVVIFEDLFTKWIEAVLLHKKNVNSIANAFKDRILFRHSIPEKFISDNGVEFCNCTMFALAKERNFTHVKLAPRHPQADPVEKVNRTLKSMIKSHIIPDHQTWADDLAGKAWYFNISIHESTGYSPFYLCNGRHPTISSSLKRIRERKAAAEWDKKLENLELNRVK